MKPTLSPPQWPFAQPHVLLAIEQCEHVIEQLRLKSSTSIRDVEFHSSDGEGTGYSPSETSESEERDSDESEAEVKEAAMDVDVDEDEVEDLTRDVEENEWPSSPTLSKKERSEEIQFQKELRTLEAAESEAIAAYDPDEVVDLMTEFYELLVELGHWPVGVIQKAPHTDPPVNAELVKQFGFGQVIVELMQKLPYVKSAANQQSSLIIPDSRFYNYTEERDLKRAKTQIGYEMYGSLIDSRILPLAGPSNSNGWSIVLDTRLGVIRAYVPIEGPQQASIEYRRHGKGEEGVESPAAYHHAPLVPAAKSTSGRLNWYYENMEDEQSSILGLYEECGWPDHWDRSAFVEKWNVLEVQLRERGRERMKRDKVLT